jgi:hypothetical protein
VTAGLVVIVPSRGRPERFRHFLDAFTATRELRRTELVVALDRDDPTRDDYPDRLPSGCRYSIDEPLGFAPRFNRLASLWALDSLAIGNFGDDHLPRTPGWDARLLDAALNLGSGVVYPNDLWQREALPTAPVITSDIVRALGWYSPPRLRHVYVDNFWRALGIMLGRFRYLPDVIVEHMHPSVPDESNPELRKAAVDATYESQTNELQVADAAEWERYRRDDLERDVARVREKLAL